MHILHAVTQKWLWELLCASWPEPRAVLRRCFVRCKITLGRALPAGDNIGRGSGSILLLPFWLQSPCKNPQGFLEMVSTYMNLSGNNKLDGSQASQNQMSGIRWVHAVHFLFAATLVLTNCSVWMENMHRKGSAPHTQLSYTMSHRLSMFNS